MFSSGANYSKLKTNLRLTINRLKLLEKKKTELGAKARKEIADYISAAKDDRARIRVEHIIREDYLVEAMELLEMYCDLLLARFGMIQTQKDLDPGLEESIASIIWATPRLQADVQELKHVSDQFTAKYGKEFTQACRTNELNNVSEKVMHKLGVEAPPKILVERYMMEIARTYNVPFEPDPSVMAQDELFQAENVLIDLNLDDKKGGGGGGGGGMGVMAPHPMSYPPPPPPPQQSQYPPPNQAMMYPPPQGNFVPPPPLPQAPPVATVPDPAYPPPHQMGNNPSDYDNWLGEDPKKQLQNPGPAHPPQQQPPAPGFKDGFPELPTVPTNTLPELSVGTSSAGGDDVDFDDLTRRFEQLKKKK